MTKIVRGAGRAKHARNRRHNNQEERVVGGDRTEAVRQAVGRGGGHGPWHPKVQSFADAANDAGWTVGVRRESDGVERVSATRGLEVLQISWLAGVYQRWATWSFDGGPEQRVPNAKSGLRVLGRTEAEVRSAISKVSTKAPTRPRSRVAASGSSEEEVASATAEDRVRHALSLRSVPWDSESTDEELLKMLEGRRITWVNGHSGTERTAQVPKATATKHNKIEHGNDGPYISFASMEGPFQAVSLSRIIHVS